MNMKKIIVELSSSWTLANVDGGLDPASKLVEKLKSILPASTEYAVDSFTVIDIVIDADIIPAETAVEKIKAAFVELFGAESQNSMTISVQNQEKPAEEIAPLRNCGMGRFTMPMIIPKMVLTNMGLAKFFSLWAKVGFTELSPSSSTGTPHR